MIGVSSTTSIELTKPRFAGNREIELYGFRFCSPNKANIPLTTDKQINTRNDQKKWNNGGVAEELRMYGSSL